MASKTYPNGARWLQSQGKEVTIVEHLGGADFLVKFEDSPIFKSQAKEIRIGNIKDRLCPEVSGTGFMGWGDYPAKVGNKNTPAYEVWRGIIRRCYNQDSADYCRYGGNGITVSDDWKNYQNFAEWYYDQYKNYSHSYNTKFDVDKDLRGREYLFSRKLYPNPL